ncbi:putative reverse [Rosellinia necatrix]|uniref:Putative reverse n=1 Tax=Rosellinia necatrix TaxID=77044 RepID=A0A1S7UJW1_ROSNE|nr:putative reverse [Rosellinia necatrix]
MAPRSNFSLPPITSLVAGIEREQERMALYSHLTSVKDCIEAIPTTYREALRPVLFELANVCERYGRVNKTLHTMRTHKTNGTLPPQLKALKDPEFQYSKDFLGNVEGDTPDVTIGKLLNSFKEKVLQGTIDSKKAEVSFLGNLLQAEVVNEKILHVVTDVYNERKTFQDVHNRMEEDEADSQPASRKSWLDADFERAKTDCPLLAQRVIDITRARDMAELNKALAKVAIHQKAKEAKVDKPTLENLHEFVDRKVAEEVKRRLAQTQGTCQYTCPKDNLLILSRRQKKAIRRFRKETQENAPKEGTQGLRKRPKDEIEDKEQTQEVNSRKKVRYDIPSTFPDNILTEPLANVQVELLTRMPMIALSAFGSVKKVHVLDGISLPSEIESSLALGNRYLIHDTTKVKLLEEAWRDFEIRIRWKCLIDKPSSEPYDPDLDMSQPTFDPGLTKHHIEQGLKEGRSKLMEQINRSHDVPSKVYQERLRLNNVQRYLQEHKLLATASDKNLGVVVMSLDWYHKNCEKFLDNAKDDLIEITATEAFIQNNITWNKIEALVDVSPKYPSGFTEQEKAFLRQAEDFKDKFPTFTGLPKIHKKPFAFRPIIPCHKATCNPAAKILSKLLKKAINSNTQIITSSKQLCITLSSLAIQPQRTFLVTADVVACYSNIPLSPIKEMCERMVWKHSDSRHKGPYWAQVAGKLADIANNHLVFKYGSRYFHQKKGLAMGVACSPDIANLYMAEHELHVNDNPNVLYYGRYIDDILCIYVSDSMSRALTEVKELVKPAPGLTYTWEVGTSTTFLDLEIKVSDKIEFRPFRKPLNHFERIPWTSAHPKWMKKGTFIGELQRLATLSSTIGTYFLAVEDLKRIYLARDYPYRVIMNWISEFAIKRWIHRFDGSKKEKEKEGLDQEFPFILKSYMNDAWNDINLDLVFNAMWDTWNLMGDDIPPELTKSKGMIVSRKRTRNMEDLLRASNATLIRHLDNRADADLSSDLPPLASVFHEDTPVYIHPRSPRKTRKRRILEFPRNSEWSN